MVLKERGWDRAVWSWEEERAAMHMLSCDDPHPCSGAAEDRVSGTGTLLGVGEDLSLITRRRVHFSGGPRERTAKKIL